jgi:hypothetical protein
MGTQFHWYLRSTQNACLNYPTKKDRDIYQLALILLILLCWGCSRAINSPNFWAELESHKPDSCGFGEALKCKLE